MNDDNDKRIELLASYMLQLFERVEILEARLSQRLALTPNPAIPRATAPYAEDYKSSRIRELQRRCVNAVSAKNLDRRPEDELVPKVPLRDRDPEFAERWRKVKLA